MAIKHEIKVDKENKVLTLLVNVPRKKFAREENITFTANDAWELAKGYNVAGHKVQYKRNRLEVDNWRICNHEGKFTFPLEEIKSKKKSTPVAKAKKKPLSPKLKTDEKPKSYPRARRSSTKKSKD